MGSKPCICVVKIDLDCPSTTGDRHSFCGSDAFYRDAFPENEIMVRKDGFAGKAWEQAMLKSMKGKVFLDYAKFSAKQTASVLKRQFSGAAEDGEDASSLLRNDLSPVEEENYSPVSRTLSDWKGRYSWLGETMREWKKDGLPPANHGPYWKKGAGDGLQVRCGPNYLSNRSVMTTQPGHMYDCLTVDAIRAPVKLDDIIGRVVEHVPPPAKGSTWTPDCPLPRVLCINVMLPHYNPKNPWAKDEGGCSYVGFFEIANETVEQVSSENPPPHVRLFREFCEGPAGAPGCSLDDPDRSLGRRRDTTKKKDLEPRLLRAAGWCMNQTELGVPEFLHQFNGKSFVIADSGYIIRDPVGEWVEFGFDVRLFPFLFVDVLYNFRDFIPKAKCHYGFTVQAVDDEDLPEGIICDLYMSGIDITQDPAEVSMLRPS